MKTITYQDSDKELMNPARGFYVQFDSADTEKSAKIKMSEMRKKGMTLAMIGFDIKDYVNMRIGVAKLSELEFALHKAKSYGLKVILRTAYGFTSASKFKDPSDIEVVKQHILQISPIVNKYADIIYCVQAGFIGAWGEWHSSNLLTEDESADTIVRNSVLSTLLQSLVPSIPVDVRRPRFIREAARAGIDVSRLGIHNDALLSTEDDMGTYDDPAFNRQAEFNWIRQDLGAKISGGEMPLLGPFSQFENALDELNELHISYLNHEYNKDVLKSWAKSKFNQQTALSYIESHLGYRLFLKEVAMPEKVNPNSVLNFKLSVLNTGYAAPPSNYTMEIAIMYDQKVTFYPIEGLKPNSLLSNELITFDALANTPNDLVGLPFKIGLRIRPAEDTIKIDLNYIIELSNKSTKYIDGTNYFCEYTSKNHFYTVSGY